jgi:tRNA threonylcarbamoyladenosine biosynthesis protein TsaB
MLILNIETTTKNCSVTLAKNGKTIAVREIAEQGYSHAELLHVFIDEVFLETNHTFSQLSAVAVSHGPGSYTGLRIGVSAAKGLCYGLNIPLISTDTLFSLAIQAGPRNGVIIPMIDARRMEVYTATFSENLEKTTPTQALIINENSFSQIQEDIYIVGDCQLKIKEVLHDKKFHFLSKIEFPSAKTMSQMSFDKFQKQAFENLAYFEPLYLKDFLVLEKKK